MCNLTTFYFEMKHNISFHLCTLLSLPTVIIISVGTDRMAGQTRMDYNYITLKLNELLDKWDM